MRCSVSALVVPPHSVTRSSSAASSANSTLEHLAAVDVVVRNSLLEDAHAHGPVTADDIRQLTTVAVRRCLIASIGRSAQMITRTVRQSG